MHEWVGLLLPLLNPKINTVFLYSPFKHRNWQESQCHQVIEWHSTALDDLQGKYIWTGSPRYSTITFDSKMKTGIHNHISHKVTPQKWETAAWPTGKITKEPEKAAAPGSMMCATTSAFYFGQSYDFLDTLSVGLSLGKNNPGVAENTVTKSFYNTCTGIPKLWHMCHQLYGSHFKVILCCAACGTGHKSPQNLISYYHNLTPVFPNISASLPMAGQMIHE